MYGYAILKHSIRQIFGNLWGALQVSLLPFIIQTLVLYYIFGGPELYVSMSNDTIAGFRLETMDTEAMKMLLLQVLGGLFVAYLAALWMTVAWHRYVLLDEQPIGVFPKILPGRILSYLVMSFVYGIILAIIGIVVVFAISIVMSIFVFASHAGDGQLQPMQVVIYAFLTAIFIYIPLTVIGFRLTATLPGVATGAPVGFGEGWTATRHNGGSIIVLSVLLVLLYGANMGIMTYVSVNFPMVAIVWEAFSRWVTLMLSVSILTTLYGHYIEGRPLVV